ncbi:MAG: hypothetical protein Q7R92_05895 [bacterium]|nr:hypothetical protein [bacterium]
MSKKTIKIIVLGLLILFCAQPGLAASLGARLTGRILLQVQSKGQAWYVDPADQKRYSLGRPSEALALMRGLGIGITNANLAKIPVGAANSPVAPDPLANNFTKQNLGKIFLQIENHGEAWYINPIDQKRYFLGSPNDAFIIMKSLSLGITDENLNQITVGWLATAVQPASQPVNGSSIMEQAAAGIRNNDAAEVKTLFSPNQEKLIDYIFTYLNADGRLTLANILSGSSLTSSTADQKVYSNEVYFSLGSYKVPVKFYVKKQPDGSWLIANL